MRAIDRIGAVYGRLTVVSLHPERADRERQWVCKCECGNEVVVRMANLRNGSTNSCGCLRNVQGGLSNNHPLWKRWSNMIDRCHKPANKDFKNYGARGIKVCERWHHFPSYLEDMMPSFVPGSSIDRIDNDGPYSPENCRWATPIQQTRNRRKSVIMKTPWGKKPLIEVAKIMGINRSNLRTRIKIGWSYDRLFDPNNWKKMHRFTSKRQR